MAQYYKIGLIAGRGKLPHAVVAAAKQQGSEVYIAALKGFSRSADFENAATDEYRLGEFGRLVKTLKAQKVEAITFAGYVTRPDFSALRPDLGAVKYLPGVIKAATKGDDALLAHVTALFEKQGIAVVGPQEICHSLLAPEGVLGKIAPKDAHQADINKARQTAKDIGALDIGQGAIVCAGLVLAVEAQEGTDAMLSRVAVMSAELRGASAEGGGVLAKMVKPGQELRVDMPTIGPATVQLAYDASLSGIALEAGRAFIIDREAVTALADSLGLFIIGLTPEPYAPPQLQTHVSA